MRVLYVVPGPQDGILMIFAYKQISDIEKTGIETFTVNLSNDISVPKFIKDAINIRSAIKQFEPDIVHAQFGTKTSFICALTCYAIPMVITYRGSDLNPSPSDGLVRSVAQKFFSQISALRAKKIICVSEQLKERLWWRRNKVIVLPSGTDLKHFRPMPRDNARDLLHWENDSRVILFNAGRNPAVKRLDLANDAVKVVMERLNNIKFIVLEGRTNHDQIPLYMSGADCLLVTSDYEGSPDIVKEAMACNLPIVSVDVGDVKKRLINVHPSAIVARDPQVIGRALVDILKSGLRSNGRENICGLSDEIIRDEVIKAYKSLN